MTLKTPPTDAAIDASLAEVRERLMTSTFQMRAGGGRMHRP